MTAPQSPSMDDLVERSAPRNPWIPTLKVLGVLAIIGALVIVGVNVFGPSSGSRWRTATVATHDVTSAITGVAAIEPVSEAAVAFPVAGTVSTVAVVQGSTVEIGQALATLDTVSFEDALHTKQAALATAKLDLQKALDAQAAASTTTTTTGGATPLQQAQQRVVFAQRQVDSAMTASDAALAATTQPCASPSTPPQITACRQALQRASQAQDDLAAAQRELADATTALDALLNQQAGGGSRPSTPTTTVPTAADIAVLQAKVDAAQAAVTVAEQNLLQTVITSPIAGRVVAVNLTVGATITANSTTSTIVVQGAGGFESTMSISVDQVPNVRVGQRATVLPDGDAGPIAGRVAQVALAPTSSTTGSVVTYRVTIALEGTSIDLHNGTVGTGSIVTAVATGVSAVPTSAVHLSSAGRTVVVLDGSTTRTVSVEVGVVGDDRTQILSGVEVGQLVVLADLDEPLPGTATKSTSTSVVANQFPQGQFPGGPNGGQFPGGNPPTRPGG